MSIRWKLFVALFLLTAGAISLVLVLAEQEFRAATREEVGRNFDAQIKGLLAARTERLDHIRSLCSQLAELEVLRKGLRGPLSDEERQAFLARFEELREPLRNDERFRPGAGGTADSGEAARPRPIRRPTPLMGLVTLDGQIRPLGGTPPRRVRERPRRDGAGLEELADPPAQAVAYVVPDTDSGDPRGDGVQEVVVTPVLGADDRMLGWFFLGRSAQTRDEQVFQRAEALSGRDGRTGIVVEDQWFVPGITDETGRLLAASFDEGFWSDRRPEIVEIGGESFLIVAAALNPDSPLGRGWQVTLFPVGTLIEAVEDLRWQVAGLGLVAVVAAAAGSLFLSKRFSEPIAALVEGTERVRRGELEGEVEVAGRDEFARLATAFNAMTRDLALKERYREVLGKVSDPAVAQRLVEGELELGGEVVEAAVLFCDIRGFTAMTEGMPPAEVIEMLNEHMTALTRLVYLHGGVVDKFVGDLVMALFGVPQTRGDDALRAARCAVAMLEERRKLDRRSGRRVEIGVGVAYGELVAGCMGSTDRLNYTVLGDRVNLASRLCSAAGPGEVLVDAPLAELAADSFRVEEREPVALKGFSRPVPVFALRPPAPSEPA